MRFILRKYVDAENAADALKQDKKTPVHDVYLKDGEEPRRVLTERVVGFWQDTEVGPGDSEPVARKKR
jgi:hypothetical protein